MPGGETKVIERFDCSGCGDVDMTKKATVKGDGTILGLSGRSLKVRIFWGLKLGGTFHTQNLKCSFAVGKFFCLSEFTFLSTRGKIEKLHRRIC